jgi:hypothetical protein
MVAFVGVCWCFLVCLQLYGALIAACAQGIKARSSDRKEQLVVLERAFQVLQDALDAGVHLETPAWNALLMCAGMWQLRGAQLRSCLQVPAGQVDSSGLQFWFAVLVCSRTDTAYKMPLRRTAAAFIQCCWTIVARNRLPQLSFACSCQHLSNGLQLHQLLLKLARIANL